MKKVLISLGLSVCVILCWVIAISSKTNDNTAEMVKYYEDLCDEQLKMEGYGMAIKCMKQVVSLEDTVEKNMKLAEVYYKAQQVTKYIDTLEGMIDKFPDDITAYEELSNYYYKLCCYKECLQVVKSALNSGITNDDFTAKYYECSYKYSTVSSCFTEAGNFSNGYSVVKYGEKYGILTAKMKNRYDMFEYADIFSDGIAAVTLDGKTYFIDESGVKYLAVDDDVVRAYSFSEGYAVIEKSNGKYSYIGTNGKVAFGDYLYATKFSNGVAAVCDKDGWKIIDSTGNKVVEQVFKDVKVSEDNYCSRMGVIFVSDGKGYYLINTKGKKLGEEIFDEVEPFYTGNFAAVCKKDKWGFLSVNGELTTPCSLEGARSFGGDIAAFCENGKWGFMISSGKVVIEPTFDDAKCFSENKAPIKVKDDWMYISLP